MKLLTFDYETTSNKPQSTRGVQLAAVSVDLPDGKMRIEHGEHVVLLNEITDPQVDIHHEAAEIHGITPEMVQGMRPDYIASQDLYDYIEAHQNEIILNSHNGTTFDVPILGRLAQMNSDRPRPPIPLPHIDSLVLATRLFPDAPNHKLSVTPSDIEQAATQGKTLAPGLTQYLKLGTGEGAHDALNDIRMVQAITCFVRQRFRNGEFSFADLAAWCAVPRILKICHFGKWKGKPWGKGPGCVPAGYVHFICDKFEDTTPDMIATIKHHYGMTFKYTWRKR